MMLPALNWQVLALKALAVVLAAAVLFGAGYAIAVRQYERQAAEAAQVASEKATKAQAAKDARDYAADKADMAKRSGANVKAAGAFQTIYRDRLKLVPSPAQCVVPKAAMHALNDPALIGSN